MNEKDNMMKDLARLVDYTENGISLEDMNKKYNMPIISNDNYMDIVEEGNKNKILLATLVQEKYRNHESVSYFNDVLPYLESCVKYKKSDNMSLIESREEIMNMMRDAFFSYNTICIPKIVINSNDDGVDVEDILIYNKEDLI